MLNKVKELCSKLQYAYAVYKATMSARAGEPVKLPLRYRYTKEELERIDSKIYQYIDNNIPRDYTELPREHALYKALLLLKYAESHPLFEDFLQVHLDCTLMPQSRYHFDVPDNLKAIEALTHIAAELLEYAVIRSDYTLDLNMVTIMRGRKLDVGVLSKDSYGATSFYAELGKDNHNYILEFGRITV